MQKKAYREFFLNNLQITNMKLSIEIHHFIHLDGDNEKILGKVLSIVNQTNSNIKTIMGKVQDFDAVLGRIDAATSAIAAEITDLKTQIQGNGLSDDVEAAVLAKLDAAATKLEGIGKADTTPVTPEPTPTTTTETTPVDNTTAVDAGSGDVDVVSTPEEVK
jgi:hypothetical protein